MAQNTDLAKAKGSAETYAIKYFLQKFFLIPTDNNLDPDAFDTKSESKDKPNETSVKTASSNSAITNQQNKELIKLIRQKCGSNLELQNNFFKEVDKSLGTRISGVTNIGNLKFRLSQLTTDNYQTLTNWLNNLESN